MTDAELAAMPTGTVICAEHGTTLDDPDLIDAIIESRKNEDDPEFRITDRAAWDKLPRAEQVALQLSWVEPMPVWA